MPDNSNLEDVATLEDVDVADDVPPVKVSPLWKVPDIVFNTIFELVFEIYTPVADDVPPVIVSPAVYVPLILPIPMSNRYSLVSKLNLFGSQFVWPWFLGAVPNVRGEIAGNAPPIRLQLLIRKLGFSQK